MEAVIKFHPSMEENLHMHVLVAQSLSDGRNAPDEMDSEEI